MLTEMQLRDLGLGHEARERYVANIIVAGGAAVLDGKDPEWHRRIDTKKIDMSTTHSCILGQLYGSHLSGAQRLGLKGDMDYALGFVCPNNTHTVMLSAAWTYEVNRRIQARS